MSKLDENVGFYRKMSDLQERLRRSEEERLHLEEKFAHLMRACRDEEEARLSDLRERYEEFLEEEKQRRERNERILQALDRVESRAAILTAKSERLRLLRRHYETYMLRLYPGWKYITGKFTSQPSTPKYDPLQNKLSVDAMKSRPYSTPAQFPSDTARLQHTMSVPEPVLFLSDATRFQHNAISIPEPVLPSDTARLQHNAMSVLEPVLPSDTARLQHNATSVLKPVLPSDTSRLQHNAMSIPEPMLPSDTTRLQNNAVFIPESVLPSDTSRLQHSTMSVPEIDVKEASDEFVKQSAPAAESGAESLIPSQRRMASETGLNKLDNYLAKAAEMLQENDSINRQASEANTSKAKETKQIGNANGDFEQEQNTSGDILNVSLSDDGILQEETSQSEACMSQEHDMDRAKKKDVTHLPPPAFQETADQVQLAKVSELNDQNHALQDNDVSMYDKEEMQDTEKVEHKIEDSVVRTEGAIEEGREEEVYEKGEQYLVENATEAVLKDHTVETVQGDELSSQHYEQQPYVGTDFDQELTEEQLAEYEQQLAEYDQHYANQEGAEYADRTEGAVEGRGEAGYEIGEQYVVDNTSEAISQDQIVENVQGDELSSQHYEGQAYVEGDFDQELTDEQLAEYDQQLAEYDHQYEGQAYVEGDYDQKLSDEQLAEYEQQLADYDQQYAIQQEAESAEQHPDQQAEQDGVQQGLETVDQQGAEYHEQHAEKEDGETVGQEAEFREQHAERQEGETVEQHSTQQETESAEQNAEKQVGEIVDQQAEFPEQTVDQQAEFREQHAENQEGETVDQLAEFQEGGTVDQQAEFREQHAEKQGGETVEAESREQHVEKQGTVSAEPEVEQTGQKSVAGDQHRTSSSEGMQERSESEAEVAALVDPRERGHAVGKRSKLPGLTKMLESDSESLQLDATVSNVDSDDFDFSSDK